ncbi:MAG: proton-conducting membrane transporter, partial [Lachnospiraceae bacterium]|nr:proton-conducting membrane transporter [Lachnospiraceae bacterium]
GIASSANLMTMYMFYELLTLVTIPLVMHEMNHKSIRAAIKYFTYSIGGAAFAFMGFIIITKYCGTNDFVYGGIITNEIMQEKAGYVYLAYILMFFGFGVKTAVFPFHGWLPSAGVAPTPVTALLHAVAVVKSGAFAIIRVTYFIFGAATLKGTVGEYIPLAFVIFTIVFGSSMAVKEQHLKRRFAYSTISNLSYILFGVLMLSPAGLTAGLLHMVFHGVMKIAIFFCAGAIMHQTGYEYIYEINGFGFKMKKIFAVYSIASLAVVGIPPLPGFYSKLALAKAAIENGDVLSYIGIAALLISALLTAVYLMSIMVRAYFRPFESDKEVKDPNAYMVIPQFVFCAMMIGFSLFGSYICNFMAEIVNKL